MKKFPMRMLLAAALILLAAALAGCAKNDPPAKPIVAKWVLRDEDAGTQVMYSFEATGDVEIVRWARTPESGEEMAQTEALYGEYALDEVGSALTLTLENGETLRYAYTLVEKTELTLKDERGALRLPFAEANSGKVE